jgi:hypothetical protein
VRERIPDRQRRSRDLVEKGVDSVHSIGISLDLHRLGGIG